MTSFWQKAQLYLGLVDEEELAGPDALDIDPTPATGVATSPPGVTATRTGGRRVEPPPGAFNTGRGGSTRPEGNVIVTTSGAATGAVRAVPPVDVQSEIIEAGDFADAKLLADRIRERMPVVLNLRGTEPDMVRRLVDFASGLTYALDGTMTKISEGTILVLPPRMSLGREEKRRLVDLGLYSLPDSGI